MADGNIWKVVKELRNRVEVLEDAHNSTIERYDSNFKMLEDRAKDLARIVNNNAEVVIADEENFGGQIDSLKAVVNSLCPIDNNTKFTKVWVAVGFGSLAIFWICRKLQKIEDRIDAIEEEKGKR